MSEEILQTIKNLLAVGRGDSKRLREIIETIKKGEPVVMSDYRYILNLTQASNDKEEQIQKVEHKIGSSLELLRIRLAEGKISIEEFRELKKTLTEKE
jgi:hypothetical protein